LRTAAAESAAVTHKLDRDGASLARRAGAEALGTALLVCAVIGSGIAASRLSSDPGLQLLENTVATAAALAAIILTIGPVSGAHLNPVVTIVDCVLGRRHVTDAVAYIPAQIVGGCAGAIVANAMFELPLIETSTHTRSGSGIWIGEVVATFGLILVIFGMTKGGEHRYIPFAVAGYIAGAYWFTSSTSFANPAVTAGRTLSNTFAGIAPASAPLFVVFQIVGGALALGAVLLLYPRDVAAETFSSQTDESVA
jgi:arsenate reductase